MAIETIRRKGLQRFIEKDDARGLPAQQAAKIRRMLSALATAEQIEDMALYPGWRLHSLKGDLAGFWSLTVTGNWRLIFRFEDGGAYDLDLTDYH